MLIRRVVVADDEKIQRDVLSAVLQRLLPGAQVIACADGQEAWEEIGRGETQLLLTDICMPVLDGIGLIERVSEEYPGVKIVLISAYQEFEYARSAIRFGVSEYLLKPFRIEDARKLVHRISAILEEEQEQGRRQTRYDAMLEQVREDERQDMLRRLMAGTDGGAVPADAFPELRAPGVVVMILWKSFDGKTRRYREGTDRSQREALWKALRKAEETGAHARGLPVELERGLNRQEHRCAYLLPGMDEEQAVSRLSGVLAELREQGIVVWAGISGRQEELYRQLPDAAGQADEALSFYFYAPFEGGIFTWGKLCAAPDLPLPSLSVHERKLREAVRRGEREEIRETLKRLEEELGRGTLYYPSRVKHRISSVVLSIIREVEGMIPQEEYDLLLNETYERYGQCDSLWQLFVISGDLLIETAEYFIQAPEAYDAVESCVAWMRQHLEEDISLQTLADMVHFHPNCLSAQIRKRLGVSFSTWLLTTRMEMACRLLTETDYRVLDIARRCGFRDGSYFNRMFRREYKMSPEQFRKVHTSCRQG